MEHFLIPRRFVRIKALQNLYAYTISQIAYKKAAIEHIKKDFIFNIFLDEPDQKAQRAKEQSIAVALFSEIVATTPSTQAFAYTENKKIEQSVGRHLVDYLEALKKDRILLQNGFNTSKASIYTALLYVLQLLVTWYKLAQQQHEPSKPNADLLNHQLAHNPLLAEWYSNCNWAQTIYKNGLSEAKGLDQAENWYRQFIESTEIPKEYRADSNNADSNNNVKLLEYILQYIIFQEGPINDFIAMTDLYWDEHKRIVQRFLNRIFMMLATKDFTTFALVWDNLAPKWAIETEFYNHLVTVVIDNSARYEAMISKTTQKWDSERILLIDKLILKLALAELLDCKEIPLKVSINEYIEIAKWYGTSKSGCFINGVLEGILKGHNNDNAT